MTALRLPFSVLCLLVSFAWLWFVLINHLRVEWTLNPQYGYGWAVPFLCLYLAWQGIQRSGFRNQKLKFDSSASSFRLLICAFCFLAFLYFPTRLIQEANPEWRLVSWALAIEVVGLTLLVIYFALGATWLKRLAFPVCYFLVAVPWPTMVESPLIQGLTRADTGATTELFNWLGIPAIPHGNVIEVATGQVGIDEACSGIRSFQATLMISLFLGEFYRLNLARRTGLIFGGFAMSFLFNLARMSILVWIAAHQGVAAISKWHDPTGVTILLACFCGLWGMGMWFNRKQETSVSKSEGKNQKSEIAVPSNAASSSNLNVRSSAVWKLAPALAIWIFAGEISVAAWYHWHEVRLPREAQWTAVFPTNNVTFAGLSLPERARQILRYNEGRSARWEDDHCQWQAIFLRWNPGRTAIHLAQNHTPAVCLTAAGHTLKSISDLQWFDVNGLRLPFAIYKVTDTPEPFFVFYCLWDDRAVAEGFSTMSLNYGNRLAPVLAGLRNPGQRSLEIAVNGPNNADEAEAAARKELEKLIRAAPKAGNQATALK